MPPFNGQGMSPMMFAPWLNQQDSNDDASDSVPARVAMAMQFLNDITKKTMQRPVVSDVLIQIMDGQKLTTEEEATQATALNLMNQYFAGQLTPNRWEEVELKHSEIEILPPATASDLSSLKIMKCSCTASGSPAKPECPLCEGRGNLIIRPGLPQGLINLVNPKKPEEDSDEAPEGNSEPNK